MKKKKDTCDPFENQYCDHMNRILYSDNQMFTKVWVPCPDGGFYTILGVETDTSVTVFSYCPWCGAKLIPKQICVEPSDTIDYD